MKAWDLPDFKKKLPKGYKIGKSTNHHVIVNPDGDEVIGFAISHSKSGKDYVLDIYVKNILAEIEKDIERRKKEIIRE